MCVKHNTLARRPAKSAGAFTIVEVVLSMVIVMMMCLIFGAAMPVALHGTQTGSNFTEAALTAQHKIDQLRTIPFASLATSASLQSQGVIDAANPDGTYDFSTTTTDGLSVFFPTGTTGTLSLQPDTTTGTMSGNVYDATVTISWPASGAPAGSFTLRNKIIDY